MKAQSVGCNPVLIALGANVSGPWGTPEQTLKRALQALERAGIRILARSKIHATAPVGSTRQARYANAVAAAATTRSPEALMHVLKRIEAGAGRRSSGRPWGPRALDLDLIAYGPVVRNWRGRRPRHRRAGPKPLTLPHPLMHERAFVLGPLTEIASDWRHPVLHSSVRRLWQAVRGSKQGRVLD